MDSERVRQLMDVIVDRTTKNLKDELVKEVTENVTKELREEFSDNKIIQERTFEAVNEGYDKIINKIEKAESENSRGFWSKLFGK